MKADGEAEYTEERSRPAVSGVHRIPEERLDLERRRDTPPGRMR